MSDRTELMASMDAGDQPPSDASPRTALMTTLANAGEPKKSGASIGLYSNPINDAIDGFMRQTGAGLGGGAVAGVRGLYDLATGKGSDQATHDVEETQRRNLGYQPKTPAEQAGARAAGSGYNPLNWPGMALEWAGKKLGAAAESAGASPGVSAALQTAPTAVAMLAGPVKGAIGRDWSPYGVAAEEGAPTVADVTANTVRNSPQSMGAAAAAPRVANTTPELQHAIVTAAQKNGGAVNPEALARHVEADTLPVPIRLTEGEALNDVRRISNERNSADLAEFYNQRNGALKQNLQALRDEVGPDVFTTNAVEHGDTLIKAYQDKADKADADTAEKYQALRDANGGKFPVDAKKLVSNVTDALHDQLLYEHAPKELGQLQALAEKGMTFEQFEAMRTNLARTMRSSTNGNEKAAAGVIRQQMEDLPLTGNTAQLKPLADTARAAARTQFQALEADPAYKAAVNSTVSPDQFVRKFVTGGTRDNVAKMQENLAHDPVATQTMGVAAVDSLRDAAGVKPDGTGNFAQANYNKQRLALDPKIKSLLSPQHAETVEQLGNVARTAQEQPSGNFINNSKTFVANAAAHGAGLVAGAVDLKSGGLPLGSMALEKLSKRQRAAAVKRITAHGAGLDVLDTQP